MQLGLLRKGDWAGIATMAIGLGALQTVLEEGNKDDWFGSDFIVRLSIIAAIALIAFLVIELTVKNPVINLRLLAAAQFRPRHRRQSSCWAPRSTARPSCCRSICRRCRATTRSRSARCWRGPASRSSS